MNYIHFFLIKICFPYFLWFIFGHYIHFHVFIFRFLYLLFQVCLLLIAYDWIYFLKVQSENWPFDLRIWSIYFFFFLDLTINKSILSICLSIIYLFIFVSLSFDHNSPSLPLPTWAKPPLSLNWLLAITSLLSFVLPQVLHHSASRLRSQHDSG